MRFLLRSAVFAMLSLAPAAAMAFVWPFAQPSVPESDARLIAMDHGVVTVTDIDGTLDGDWHIRGDDPWGHEIELVIDGSTGEVERAEMDSN